MKKISVLIIATLLSLLSILSLSACEENHECDYIWEIPSKTFVATEPSCTTPGTYYRVCICGKTSSLTFVNKDKLAHNFTNEIQNSDTLKAAASCTNPATYYKSCDCGETGSETFTVGEALPHTYNMEIKTDMYLKSEATYVSKSEYYYSCKCGKVGDTTFFGDYLICEGSANIGFTLSSDESHYIVTDVSAVTDKNLIIPFAYNGKYVTEIDIPYTQTKNTYILTVTIPETITSISTVSFRDCVRLCEVIDHSEMGLSKSDGLNMTAMATLVHQGEESQIRHGDGYDYVVGEYGNITLIELDSSYDSFNEDNTLRLPDLINGLPYIIAPYAVSCADKEVVIIPDGSTYHISSAAFYDFNEASCIIIPESATLIETEFVKKADGCPEIYILCKAASEGYEWQSYWNTYDDPVYYGYNGNTITYYFYIKSDSGIEYHTSITSAYPVALPTVESTGYEFEGWYLDENCTNIISENMIYVAADYETQIYGKWSDKHRDGTSMDTAYLISRTESAHVVISSGYRYYEFTAEASGYYTFYSTGNYDTRIYIYNEYSTQLGSNDDGGTGQNFRCQIYINAGETVYARVQQYSQGYANFQFYVS